MLDIPINGDTKVTELGAYNSAYEIICISLDPSLKEVSNKKSIYDIEIVNTNWLTADIQVVFYLKEGSEGYKSNLMSLNLIDFFNNVKQVSDQYVDNNGILAADGYYTFS
ncbi:hypothetical protein D0U04_18285 [Bacillus clarus]|uniref:Uncharacterized protein n=1 Tax=Bacillus clarus TaxID=2338372 RepID=A0A090YSH1_9BACI|nr:hypothetical protein [Bacillus clarus]KFN01799.1 hypothetical protein DJ93_4340 [Bacillus clarus]RFT65567.1 hypothetical protein D0U04_18285 [Bacillus clarus]